MHEVQRAPLRPRRYLAPSTLTEALAALAELGTSARMVAGGTDLMVELDRRVGASFDVLIDISRIPGLDKVTEDNGRIQLGPLVTHNQCATNDLIRRHGLALAQASLEVGSPALRNRATVVGNVVTSSPANDTISALRVLEAQLELTSLGGNRTVSLAEFHTGVRATTLRPDEIVTGLSFPAQKAGTSLFVKAGLRTAQAISVVHIAVACEVDPQSRVCTDVRIALGSVAPTIVRATEAEEFLEGQALEPDTIDAAAQLAMTAVDPIDDMRATATYRSNMVATTVRRGLAALGAGEERVALPARPATLGGPNVLADDLATDLTTHDTLSCIVNGDPIEAPWRSSSLLTWLRDEAGLTGTKEGCAEGECGACTVHLDGVATLSCLVPAGRAQGTLVTTIEGLAAPDALLPLQQAFIDCAAVQCGYCIPGFLMAGVALQNDSPAPEPAELKLGLSGNLCRCTGYYSIESAFAAGTAGQP